MTNDPHAAVIAGTHSGAGKTTWTLALSYLAKQKGLTVQPFKCGPDYIDTSFHSLICQPRKSRNLDLFLLSQEYLQKTFAEQSEGADLLLIEGMMGLFDGKKSDGIEASTAEIAKLLKLPVFVVIEASGLANTAAAIVLGLQTYDTNLNLAGIFFNGVKSEGHFRWLKEAVESKTGVPCLGYLPKERAISIPERHLGLMTAAEAGPQVIDKIKKAAGLLESRFDWDGFMTHSSFHSVIPAKAGIHSACHSVIPAKAGIHKSMDPRFRRADRPVPDVQAAVSRLTDRRGDDRHIAIAYDEAFSFYYEDNFDLLRQAGAELIFFSPLKDAKLPENVDLLYLGGGFPELYAARLSLNHSMMESILQFYAKGGFIYAECGGLIYLSDSVSFPRSANLSSPQSFGGDPKSVDSRLKLRGNDIGKFRGDDTDCSGKEFSLVGLIPGKIQMTDRLQHFGYHEIEVLQETFLFPKGMKLRSHEFHHSIWEATESAKSNAFYRIGDRRDGYAADRLVASYQHLHFGFNPVIAKLMTSSVEKVHSSKC